MNEVIDAAQTACSVNGWSWLQAPLTAFAAACGITGLFMAITGTPLIKITRVSK